MIGARSCERLERDDHLDGRAVGVRDDARVPRDVLGVDLGNDERHVVVHPERRGVVDHHAPADDHGLAELLAHDAPAENSAMSTPSKRLGRHLLDHELATGERHALARGARTRPARSTRSAGNSRCSSTLSISRPTAPVAPATATTGRAGIGLSQAIVPQPPPARRRHLGRDLVVLEPERRVQRPDRRRHLVRGDHARDADRRGRDHVEVHAGVGERPEHLRRDSRMRLHPGTDERDLRDRLVDRPLARAELVDDLVERAPRSGEVVFGHGERDVGRALPRRRSG